MTTLAKENLFLMEIRIGMHCVMKQFRSLEVSCSLIDVQAVQRLTVIEKKIFCQS